MFILSMIGLFVVHFIADFLLQNDWMALNKSKWNETDEGAQALLAHAGLYALCFAAIWGFWFGLITFILHVTTDSITSQWTTRLWFMEMVPATKDYTVPFWTFKTDQSRHWFFVVIGLDQLIHAVSLILTWKLLH